VVGSSVRPYTLGNTEGGVYGGSVLEAFLINYGSDRITMNFNFPIYSVSFDYEIFPDGTCPKASATCTPSTSNWPDFWFIANDIPQFHTLAIDPNVSGPYPHSPHSGIVNNEKAPQYLGLSGTIYFSAGVTKLEFVDWPRMIGIDNLLIDDELPSTPSVPEPSSMVLLGVGLLGYAAYKRKKKS
jgi:hypothetical protein